MCFVIYENPAVVLAIYKDIRFRERRITGLPEKSGVRDVVSWTRGFSTGRKTTKRNTGIKHWRYDLVARLQVALMALPLSLGIALASGAAPITGVLSAIIAGLVFLLLGGAHITISGPAAGLAPALLAGMLTLG
jgi:MFS superfamily sulfate permease-like transporter